MYNPMSHSIIVINILFLWISWIGFFLKMLCLVLTHSNMFQCIYNFQKFQFLLAVCRFIFIWLYVSCDILPGFCFLGGGIFSPIFFMYHLPPVFVNRNRFFLSWLSGLDFLVGICLKNVFSELHYTFLYNFIVVLKHFKPTTNKI